MFPSYISAYKGEIIQRTKNFLFCYYGVKAISLCVKLSELTHIKVFKQYSQNDVLNNNTLIHIL